MAKTFKFDPTDTEGTPEDRRIIAREEVTETRESRFTLGDKQRSLVVIEENIAALRFKRRLWKRRSLRLKRLSVFHR